MAYISYEVGLSRWHALQPAGDFTLFYRLEGNGKPIMVGRDKPLHDPPVGCRYAMVSLRLPKQLYVSQGEVLSGITVEWESRVFELDGNISLEGRKEISLGEFFLRSNSPIPRELLYSDTYPMMGCVTGLEHSRYREETATALRVLGFTGDFGDHMGQEMKITLPKKVEKTQQYWPGEIVAVKRKSQPLGASEHFEGIVLAFGENEDGGQVYLICARGDINRGSEKDSSANRFDMTIAMSSIGDRLLGVKAERIICRLGTMDPKQEESKFLGVVAREAFSKDDREFPAGSFGRIVKIDGDCAEISWSHPNKYELRGLRDGTPGWGQRWSVELERLNLCELKPSEKPPGFAVGMSYSHMIRTTGTPCFRVGDILYYTAQSPYRFNSYGSIVRGTVLRTARDFYDKPEYNSIVAVVGSGSGMSKEVQFTIQRKHLAPFPHTWIDRGKKVRVISPVNFRKVNLSGFRGKVVSGTDIDGDVGVEFEVDVPGAGSLDGAGKDGRCLFIPAASLAELAE